MKPITKNSSFILMLFMLAITCSKEKEENINETSQETFEVVKASNKAAAEWKKFNNTAEKLLAITATNLKTLATIKEKTLIVDEKESLLMIYTQSKNQYATLKKSLADENTTFKKDLIDYDAAKMTKHLDFSNQFLSEILDLNNNLEDLIDEVKEGPMQQ